MPPATTGQKYSGHIGSLSPQQAETLEKFRRELSDEGFYDKERHDDAYLLRFLRARRFDLAKAKKMFIDCEKWRKEFGVENLVKTFDYTEHNEVMKYYPRYYHKTDKEGRPIYVEEIGNIDIKALYKITTPERQIQNLVVEYEKLAAYRLPACSARHGKMIETSCTILDLKGVSLRSFSSVFGYVKQASAIGQNYYPERMGKFFIINAPMLFSSVWSLVKPMLDEVTAAKIVILGSKYEKVLLEYIDADSLPTKFGGRCNCVNGCHMSDAGPWNENEENVVVGIGKEIEMISNGMTVEKVVAQA
ncbi:1368_t:CDS:1 [Paraglomus brasilianum]|uniref:1368_t:CDS:1 n=1 Tax=Paraglomus brasilianum TaxID=144538 RepID=A0A9N9A272_9GLOM|nr:1368_t:CDS:1 [Paraglomus brasilianum]